MIARDKIMDDKRERGSWVLRDKTIDDKWINSKHTQLLKAKLFFRNLDKVASDKVASRAK